MSSAPEAVRRIQLDIVENQERLVSCDGHDFEEIPDPRQYATRHYLCRRCGGGINAMERHWYELGRLHGARAASNGVSIFAGVPAR